MPAIFVHLSDIHFGQEHDDRLHIHSDVKEQLIADAAQVISSLPGKTAQGILVTGDIAHSGKHEEYELAGKWLDRLAKSVNCDIFQIQVVPGNHDLDRDKLSRGAELLLNAIRIGGAAEYENILSDVNDRASLFARFEAYGRFSEGYNCALDTEGRYATNLRVELAPGRSIRFVRMNSSLLCTGTETDSEPELMVGARQFTVPRIDGEEIVVLIHHPLNWFKDNMEVGPYIRSRARVLISGHEHNPRVRIDPIEPGCDVMMLASGATVPFKSNLEYTFTYNVIEFDWDAKHDALAVTMHPRAWNPTRTCFEADEKRLEGAHQRFVLGSPNFRKGARVAATNNLTAKEEEAAPTVEMVASVDVDVDVDVERRITVQPEVDGYQLVLLRFFRDLTEGERLHILSALDAISVNTEERITQAVERRLFDWLVRQGQISVVAKHIDDLVSQRKDG